MPSNKTPADAKTKPSANGRNQSERALRTLALAIFLGFGGILIYSGSGSIIRTVSYFSTGVMVAGAALLIGGLLGFLFGIPRTLQREGAAPGQSGELAAPGQPGELDDGESSKTGARIGSNQPDYQANTNLEQISDWLTKILVGVGLTQVREIGNKLNEVSGSVARAFDSPNGNRSFSLALIIFYILTGFLFSYLWTRLYFAGALREADRESLESLTNKYRQVLDKVQEVEVKSEAAQSAAEHGVGKSEPSLEQKRLGEQVEPGPNPDDPWKGVFGGRNKRNDRELSATVTTVSGREIYYTIHLEVTSTNARKPLTGVVQFFLHDTFKDSKPVIKVGPDGKAVLDLVSSGAFTVGALADNGDTRLELDLSELESAPLDFREN